MIQINSEKCIGCLTCVSVCPFLVLEAVNGKPEQNESGLCIKCLHCAAACPQNAIRLDELEGILPGETQKFSAERHGFVEDFLMSRRSYRHFRPEPVPKDVISHALRVSAWAPSAKNQHPTKWIVVSDQNRRRQIMDHILEYVKQTGASPEIAELYERGHNVVMGNAKTLLLAYARTNAINPSVDTALALHNTELLLQAQGIGTCWAGYLARMCSVIPEIRELLKLPENCHFYGALMIGYPENEEYLHVPNRHKQPEIQWL